MKRRTVGAGKATVKRGIAVLTALTTLLGAVGIFICPPGASWGSALAYSEEESLTKEASSLTAELAELKAKLELSLGERESLLVELRLVEQERESLEREISELEDELEAGKTRVGQLIKSLYLQGNMDVLEVLVEARDLDSLWREAEAYRRFLRVGKEALEELRDRRDELAHRRAELRELTLKKQELLGALDVEGLEARVRQVEERLGAINLRLRETKNARGIDLASPVPTPVAGRLLDRVPEMPSLSHFQRTGIVYGGLTSWYGADFHGKPTASGVPFNMYDFTCAHPFLPLGTWLLVTLNGRQVVVQVNDRGPFVPGRVLDLSWRAAREIGLGGVARTTFEVLIPVAGEFRR